jgi:hypothetical protein
MVSCGINDLKVSIDSKMYVRRVEALSEEWFARHQFQALQANAEVLRFAQDDNSFWKYLLSQLLEESADGFDSAMEVWDVELLVRGVKIVVG